MGIIFFYIIAQCDRHKFIFLNTNLSESSLSCAELENHPERDTDHRGESQQPTDDIPPPWVHVLIVVLKRGIFNEGEGKGSLRKQNISAISNSCN